MATNRKIEKQFKVKHLMITMIRYFEKFDAEFDTEGEDIHTGTGLRLTADIHSIKPITSGAILIKNQMSFLMLPSIAS